MSFKPGDLCIGQNFINWPECNGMECVVHSHLIKDHVGVDSRTGEKWKSDAYLVVWATGSAAFASPHNLRLKRPPSDYDGDNAGDWDLCPWRPNKVSA